MKEHKQFMPFSENLKATVRKKAHFRCCICHVWDIEVHHIEPQEEDGPDTEENAAPLCGTCHNQFGGNPQKRKAIRETRDLWYEICEKRLEPEKANLDALQGQMKTLQSTTEDVLKAVTNLQAPGTLSEEQTQELQQLVQGFFNIKIDADFSGNQYARWLQKLDPEDARWRFLAARHDIDLLHTLMVMRANNIEVIESEANEITQIEQATDLEKLTQAFLKLSEICGMPEDIVSHDKVKLDELRKDQSK